RPPPTRLPVAPPPRLPVQSARLRGRNSPLTVSPAFPFTVSLRADRRRVMPDLLLSNSYFLDLDEHEKTIMKPYAPLGPMSLSSYLKREGADVHLHDTPFTSLDDPA